MRDALLIEKTDSKKAILFNDMTKEGLDELRKAFIPAKTSSDTFFLSPIDQYDFIINVQEIGLQKFVLEFSTRIMIGENEPIGNSKNNKGGRNRKFSKSFMHI